MKDIYQYIYQVKEVDDVDQLNELLEHDGIIIETCVKRIVDDTVYERVQYSVGRINRARNLAE